MNLFERCRTVTKCWYKDGGRWKQGIFVDEETQGIFIKSGGLPLLRSLSRLRMEKQPRNRQENVESPDHSLH